MSTKTYYFYVSIEEDNERETYVIGKGKYKVPQRSKHYRIAERMFNSHDSVRSFGFTCNTDTLPAGTYTADSHDFTADPTTT